MSLHTLYTTHTRHTTHNMLLIYQRHKPVMSIEKIFKGCGAGNTFLKSQWLKKEKKDYTELQFKAMLKKILHHSLIQPILVGPLAVLVSGRPLFLYSRNSLVPWPVIEMGGFSFNRIRDWIRLWDDTHFSDVNTCDLYFSKKKKPTRSCFNNSKKDPAKYMFSFHPKKAKEGIKPFTMPFQNAGHFFPLPFSSQPFITCLWWNSWQ